MMPTRPSEVESLFSQSVQQKPNPKPASALNFVGQPVQESPPKKPRDPKPPDQVAPEPPRQKPPDQIVPEPPRQKPPNQNDPEPPKKKPRDPNPADQIPPQKKPREPEPPAPRSLSDVLVDVSKYERIEKLGEGAFGIVYKARLPGTQQLVALKIIRQVVTYLDQMYLLREVESLLKISHPCVLSLRGWAMQVSSLEPGPAIVTDFMPNRSIEQILEQRKEVGPTRKMIWFYAIAEGMRYVHEELKMVHRDLKPANILLTQDFEAVIGDFGLAKFAQNQTRQLRQTAVAGSPVYMAPELIRDEEYDQSVDVYAFAIMAWEILAGKYAFEGYTQTEKLKQDIVKGIRPKDDPAIPPQWKKFLGRAWGENRSNRPTFGEICQGLRKKSLKLPKIDENELGAFIAKVERLTANPS